MKQLILYAKKDWGGWGSTQKEASKAKKTFLSEAALMKRDVCIV